MFLEIQVEAQFLSLKLTNGYSFKMLQKEEAITLFCVSMKQNRNSS